MNKKEWIHRNLFFLFMQVCEIKADDWNPTLKCAIVGADTKEIIKARKEIFL